MQNSKLILFLQKMRPGQLKKIQAIIDSPYFNTNAEVSKLFNTILTFAPDFESKELTKKNIFEKSFPNKKYKSKELSYLLSDILLLAEQYLIQTKFKDQSVHQHFYLLQEYTELKLEKHYNATLNNARKNQERDHYKDADFFYNEFLLESAENAHFDKERSHRFDESLQHAIDNLDLYFLTQKLKYSCEILNRRNVVASEYEIRLLDEILEYIKKNDFKKAPAIQIYYSILRTLKEPDEQIHFENLKTLLDKHTHKFSLKEARDMYAYAQNYCIKQINHGDMRFLADLFQLYKMTLESKIIFYGKYISPWSYKNITSVALRLEEFEWAEQFAEGYKERVEPKFSKDAYAYNMSSIYFAKKEFDKAHEILQDVEFSDLFLSLDAKAMMLRIYYELGEMKPLSSLLNSFRVYLKRNKRISEYQRKLYLNLIKYLKEAARIRPHETEYATKLMKKIKSDKDVAYLEWLKDVVKRKEKAD